MVRFWQVLVLFTLVIGGIGTSAPTSAPSTGPVARVVSNRLVLIAEPGPLLADYPEFVEPVKAAARFEGPMLVDDRDADLEVRAWRYSYNARGIIEMPNRLRAKETALIVVHPWGIEDGQGWKTPEPAGAADFCTPAKNRLAGKHMREVIDPFVKRLRPKVGMVMCSLPGEEDAVRGKLYRSFTHRPTEADRHEGAAALRARLTGHSYKGEEIATTLQLSEQTPVVDYFKQFPGLEAGARMNGTGYWELPIPVTRDLEWGTEDVVIYDGGGYEALKNFLKQNQIRHVLLAGYATEQCFCRTTAGYENLSRDFDVFLVGDATLATFPANDQPACATTAAICAASLDHLITQISWIKVGSGG
jgi:hypothetical protein